MVSGILGFWDKFNNIFDRVEMTFFLRNLRQSDGNFAYFNYLVLAVLLKSVLQTKQLF